MKTKLILLCGMISFIAFQTKLRAQQPCENDSDCNPGSYCDENHCVQVAFPDEIAPFYEDMMPGDLKDHKAMIKRVR